MTKSDKLSIAAVQLNIEWLNVNKNLKHLDDILLNIKPVDLLLLPETFTTGFTIDVESSAEKEDGGEVLLWLRKKSTELDCVIAGSVLVKHQNKKVNRFFWVWPDGSVCFYDKRHLFRLGNEQKYVVQGEKREIVEINGVRILPLVCYDLRFPVWSRNKNDYDVIVNVANWPGVRRNVWDTLLKARAMENQAYVVGVNRVGQDGKGVQHSGGTAVYDFNGNTLSQAKNDEESIIFANLDMNELKQYKAQFPAFLDADEFSIS